MGRPLTVMEPFRSPFYAPQFVALSQGHFADEGLDVTVRTAPASAGTVRALLRGEAQISLGGIMRSLELADREGGFLPHFIEVNSRNGFFLLARRPQPAFRWTDLAGTTVLSFAEAPTPWQCMLTVLRNAGVDPARVRIERQRPTAEAVATFRAGHGDYLEQGQPVVERLVAEGAAHVVASMGEATGPVPFSSYMTTPALLRREPDVVRAFTRAIYRTQRWIVDHDAAAMAAAIAPAFPDIERDILVRVVDHLSAAADVGARPDHPPRRLRVPAADPARRRLHQGPPPLRRPRRRDDRRGRGVCLTLGSESPGARSKLLIGYPRSRQA